MFYEHSTPMNTDINVSASDTTAMVEPSLESLQNRCILTKVGQQQLVFPSQWVGEILLIDRSQVLNLPFYDRSLLGIVHHNGNIVPLLSAHRLLAETVSQDARFKPLKETLTAIQLNPTASGLAGVGIVVDQVIGSLTSEQVNEQRLFQLSDIPSQLWQPRW
jgi:chemotaxis signal transduction protein